ncbi:MAG: DUF4340 domain-containing protein [Anaerolineae bacterium]
MKRHQQILLGVLVVQVILTAVVFWPREAAVSSGELLFPELTTDDIVALTVIDNAGEEITLRKVDGTWVLPDGGNYPVKESTITPVLEKIVALDTATLVARTESSHKALQVSDDTFQRRLDIETAEGERHTIFVGSAPRYTATHFRVAGQPETYLTSGLSTWELNPAASGWIDTAYTDVDAETLTSVVLENGQGVVTLVKDGENWTLADLAEDETIATTKTNAIVRNATGLSMMRPLGKTEEEAYGMASPNAVVTLEAEDGGTYVLMIGAIDPADNSYVAKYSESPYYVRVQEFNVKAMVENSREDFLTVPATPTPASE